MKPLSPAGLDASQPPLAAKSRLPLDFAPMIEWKPVEALRSNARNARTHSGRQLKKIARSIREFGFVSPVVVDEGGMILAGHGRWSAAKTLGLVQVPTICLDHLTPARKRAYALADNKIAEEAGWDRDILAIELGELVELLPMENIDIGATGFDAPEIDLVIADLGENQTAPEDVIREPTGRPTSRPGDLWILGKHRLLCGDARSPEDYARLMNNEKASAVFADPPYNVRVDGIVGRGRIKHEEFAFASGEMSRGEFTTFLKSTLGLAAKWSVSGAVHFVCMDWRHMEELIGAGRGVYNAMLNLCVWAKTNAGQGSFYRSQHELVGVFRVGEAAHRNNVELGRHGRNRSNVWTYPGMNAFGVGRDNALASHPTVKPVALVADALRDCTIKGDLVLDPFAGSGTTTVAAEKTGRRCNAIEYEPRFVDVAVGRWQAFTKLEAVLAGDGRAFEEISAERAAAWGGPALPDLGTAMPGEAVPASDPAGRDNGDGGDWAALCEPALAPSNPRRNP